MDKRNCKYCNKIFFHRISRGKGKGKYCSVKCQGLGKRSRVEKPCDFCKKSFLVEPHRFKNNRGKFCSFKCRRRGAFTLEVREKMSFAKKGKPIPSIQGSKNHFWRGGITSENKKIRMSMQYRLWRTAVFERDNYTCIWCNHRGGKIQADHIKPFSLFPELRLAIDNGRTLCISCHKTTDTYGGKIHVRKEIQP